MKRKLIMNVTPRADSTRSLERPDSQQWEARGAGFAIVN